MHHDFIIASCDIATEWTGDYFGHAELLANVLFFGPTKLNSALRGADVSVRACWRCCGMSSKHNVKCHIKRINGEDGLGHESTENLYRRSWKWQLTSSSKGVAEWSVVIEVLLNPLA